MNPEKLRNLVKLVAGRNISTEEARVFLQIFEQELSEVVEKATRSFVEKHFVVEK